MSDYRPKVYVGNGIEVFVDKVEGLTLYASNTFPDYTIHLTWETMANIETLLKPVIEERIKDEQSNSD